MSTAELLLLGFDLAMAGLERYLVQGQIDKWRAEGKTDAEISTLLKEMLADEIALAKQQSAAKRGVSE